MSKLKNNNTEILGLSLDITRSLYILNRIAFKTTKYVARNDSVNLHRTLFCIYRV